jgi:hypothetical protein
MVLNGLCISAELFQCDRAKEMKVDVYRTTREEHIRYSVELWPSLLVEEFECLPKRSLNFAFRRKVSARAVLNAKRIGIW